MAELTTEARPNKVTVSDAGPSRKRLSIEIPAQTVADKLRESLDALIFEAQMPGFRKGHAPRSLVQKKFGPTLKEETKRQLMAAAYSKAIEEHGLKVIGEPTNEELSKVEVHDGKPLAFQVDVEVLPEFEVPPWEGIAIRKPKVEVSDQMVGEEIQKIAINEGRLESLEACEPGDYITGHAIMTGKNGTEFYNIKGAVVQVPTADKQGKGMILGIKVDDFDKQLGRPTVGQTVTIKARGPEQHEVEGLRNTDLTVAFTVERMDRIVPAATPHILSMFGMETEDQLKESVKLRMEQRGLTQQASAMRSQVADHLLGKTTVALPERLTANQAGRNLERQRMELMYRGVGAQQIEEHMAELRAASGAEAARELKLFFILNKLREQLQIRVDESEINGQIARLAAERNERPEALRQDMIQKGQINMLAQQIAEHKTYDAILAKAVVTDVSADEYNKTVREAAKSKKKG